MATDRGRGRRGFYFSRGGKHQTHNEALYRYTRDELLSMFAGGPPDPGTTDLSSEVYLTAVQSTLLRAGVPFSHPLGEDPIAERHPKPTPEWANPLPKAEIPPQEAASPTQHEEIFEEKYSEIDRQMELKLKVEEEKEEPIPEWAESKEEKKVEVSEEKVEVKPVAPPRPVAKFSTPLLHTQLAKGDPFAKVISENGSPDLQGFTYVFPQSPPLEKIWFYQDPQNQVQGPFSSAEMYNWNLVGYFPDTLLVAMQTPKDFVQLRDLFTIASKIEEETKEPVVEVPVKSEPTDPTFSLFSYDKSSKRDSPPQKKPTVWGAQAQPAAKSLLEIQREEIETGNRKT